VTSRQRGILAATGLGLFLVFLDAMIANLALPDIQKHFGGGESTLQWVVVAYSIGMAVFIMPAGTWADRRGRRFVFLVSIVVFIVGSLGSGLAPEFWVLVVARFVQGAGGAAISVTSLALVSAEFKEPALKAKAIGIWSGIAALGLGLGPTLGGFLTEEVSWRAVFMISVPVGLVVLVLTVRFVDESVDPTDRGYDPVGQVLFALAVSTLSFAIVSGPHAGWLSPSIVVCVVVCFASGTGFLRHEKLVSQPMMDLKLFADHTYSWSIASIFSAYFFVYGALLLVTQYWQNVRGFSPIQAGLLMLPFALVMVFLPPRTGKYVARVGPLRPARIGLLVVAIGSGVLIGVLHVHLLASLAFVVIAIGIAYTSPALTALSMSRVPADRAGMASGIFSAQRAIGSTVGYALMGSILAMWLGATLNTSLEPVIPNETQREAVSDSIIDNANPYAFLAEIGPGEPIFYERPAKQDEILEVAQDDVVQGIQISLAVGGALVLALWALGQFKYARPNRGERSQVP
jgi:EmrB/QacA subfamily drug resistance transporter